MQHNELRGLVMAKYHSAADFSRSIKWSVTKTYRILNGQQLPDSSDIREICQALELTDPERIITLFSLA
jgi:hypothetical protein